MNCLELITTIFIGAATGFMVLLFLWFLCVSIYAAVDKIRYFHRVLREKKE